MRKVNCLLLLGCGYVSCNEYAYVQVSDLSGPVIPVILEDNSTAWFALSKSREKSFVWAKALCPVTNNCPSVDSGKDTAEIKVILPGWTEAHALAFRVESVRHSARIDGVDVAGVISMADPAMPVATLRESDREDAVALISFGEDKGVNIRPFSPFPDPPRFVISDGIETKESVTFTLARATPRSKTVGVMTGGVREFGIGKSLWITFAYSGASVGDKSFSGRFNTPEVAISESGSLTIISKRSSNGPYQLRGWSLDPLTDTLMLTWWELK